LLDWNWERCCHLLKPQPAAPGGMGFMDQHIYKLILQQRPKYKILRKKITLL
jgi:hypothetical protein